MKKLTSFLLSITLMLGCSPLTAMGAVDWPSDVSVESEGAIVMDADTGVILYGKNMHNAYYPASITKILTALLVVEHCDMDEMVAFSYNAVHNVEENSSNAALDVGDELSVKDCLYALLLRSANECANALAEHVAGSIEGFADMMNEKALSLGCTDSHFANPSGLNDPNHYTSAHDMALIMQAAFRNENFRMVDTEVYYRLPPTKWVKEGLEFNAHHQMMLRRSPNYYPGVIGGKTGYTVKAGNTLVTYATKNQMNLIAVILNGRQTHYSDTRKLLDFGFTKFQSLAAADHDTSYTLDNDLQIAGLSDTTDTILALDSQSRVTLPVGADFSEVTSSISYELDESAPSDAVAVVSYTYNDKQVGKAYITSTMVMAADSVKSSEPTALTEPETEAQPASSGQARFELPKKFFGKLSEKSGLLWLLAGGAILIVVFITGYLLHRRKKNEELMSIDQRRRLNRLLGDSYLSKSYHTTVPGPTFSLYRNRRRRRWFDRFFRR